MRRCIIGLLLLCGVGCTMCQNPYDYAGPTIGPNGQPVGNFTQRTGSAFNGTSPPIAGPQSPTPAVPPPNQRVPTGAPPAPPGTSAPATTVSNGAPVAVPTGYGN